MIYRVSPQVNNTSFQGKHPKLTKKDWGNVATDTAVGAVAGGAITAAGNGLYGLFKGNGILGKVFNSVGGILGGAVKGAVFVGIGTAIVSIGIKVVKKYTDKPIKFIENEIKKQEVMEKNKEIIEDLKNKVITKSSNNTLEAKKNMQVSPKTIAKA